MKYDCDVSFQELGEFLLMKKIFTLFLIFVASLKISAQFTNYRVSSHDEYQPNEVSISVNPINTNFVAVGSNLNYFYISNDGGKNWNSSIMNSQWGVWGDPCVVYDGAGDLFFSHLSDGRGVSGGYWIDRMVVQRSIDNGLSWDSDSGIGFNPPIRQQDKDWLSADLSNSQYRNNLYLAWTQFDKYGSILEGDSSRILFSRSTDHGITWSNPLRVSTRAGDCVDSDNTVEGAVPAVGFNGEVYLSWAGPLGITFAKSADGGVTFGKNIHVANLVAGWDFEIQGIDRCNGMPVTASDISNSPYKGNIYINWSDQKNGDTDIYFSRSSDGGDTWSAPKIVNNDASGRDQFFTWMCTDPVTGVIYIVFYDRRENLNPSDLSTQVYLARSNDGGITFQNYKISESSFIPNENVFFGDYINISAYNGKIFPIWMRCDNNIMSIWTAPIEDMQLATTVSKNINPIPSTFSLDQNYPNPFNPSTLINYQLPEKSIVRLRVYNLLGEKIADLVNKIQSAGSYTVNFNGSNLSSGVYFFRLEANDYIASKKMLLIK